MPPKVTISFVLTFLIIIFLCKNFLNILLKGIYFFRNFSQRLKASIMKKIGEVYLSICGINIQKYEAATY